MKSFYKYILTAVFFAVGLFSLTACSGGEANYSLDEVQGSSIEFLSRSSVIVEKTSTPLVDLEVRSKNPVELSVVLGDDLFKVDQMNNVVYTDNVSELNVTNMDYTLIVQAQDSKGKIVKQVIHIEFVDSLDAILPQINSDYDRDPYIVFDDISAFTQIDVYDPRGSGIDYSLTSTGTDKDLFVISDTGELSLKAPITTGVYKVKVVATDKSNASLFTESETITVTVVNQESDLKPTILSTTFEYIENETNSLTILASSTVAGGLVYSLDTTLDFNLFTISSTGALTFKNAPDHEHPNDFDTDNIYEVEVIVTDINNNTANKVIMITVFNIDDGIPGLGYSSFDYEYCFIGCSWKTVDDSFNNLRDDRNYRLTMVTSPQVSDDIVQYSLINNSDSNVFILVDNLLYMYIPDVWPGEFIGSVDVVAHDEHGNSAVYSISVVAD